MKESYFFYFKSQKIVSKNVSRMKCLIPWEGMTSDHREHENFLPPWILITLSVNYYQINVSRSMGVSFLLHHSMVLSSWVDLRNFWYIKLLQLFVVHHCTMSAIYKSSTVYKCVYLFLIVAVYHMIFSISTIRLGKKCEPFSLKQSISRK